MPLLACIKYILHSKIIQVLSPYWILTAVVSDSLSPKRLLQEQWKWPALRPQLSDGSFAKTELPSASRGKIKAVVREKQWNCRRKHEQRKIPGNLEILRLLQPKLEVLLASSPRHTNLQSTTGLTLYADAELKTPSCSLCSFSLQDMLIKRFHHLLSYSAYVVHVKALCFVCIVMVSDFAPSLPVQSLASIIILRPVVVVGGAVVGAAGLMSKHCESNYTEKVRLLSKCTFAKTH